MPELVLAGTAIAVILLDLFVRHKGVLTAISLIGIAVAAGFAISLWNGSPQAIFNDMLAVDNFGIFFKLLFLFIAAMVILVSIDYVNKLARFQGEYHALLLFATLGMMLMAAATDLISVFVSLELTAISFYLLVGFLKDNRSTESSLKYILLGGVASAVLLYGMALTFGFTGETQLAGITRSIQETTASSSLLASPGLVFGLVLLIAGFGFKIAAVPFHMWAPDVYEGAPTPVTLYLSVGSKVAGFAVILRVFFSAFGLPEALSIDWGMAFAVLSAVSITLGNILAIQQSNIKRMLAYSGIAHSGYIMISLATTGLSGSAEVIGQSSTLFYVVAFALADLAAFAAIIAISNKANSDLIKDYSGMGKRAPVLALVLTLGLISLTGLPPAAGFIAKFYIFSGAAANGLLWLVIIAVLNSAISAFYYLRVAKLMWLGKPSGESGVPSSPALRLVLAITCIGILLFGIAPSLLIKLAEMAAAMFAF
ncbi:MAG TPA: NADH-quinone oxidoreductase subunit N [Dehalococcoidia bacterium]|nr:NADH-quinone oxidoreductase subunit N [Dehalococcoidia bacterium]